ncbi:MAG: hypothetical protein JJU05_05505 [Verrucomicrobia bacterium]|nr:hypothetical protein [Verrucomicrobiota bacterium]MCH8526664.1 hypothetical protein [Kiritimatiellia bacterium]
MRRWLLGGLFWVASTLCLVGLAIGIHNRIADTPPGRDFAAALALLLFNHGMFALADLGRGPKIDELGLIPGLLWIGGKLFVNCFTLFLLIGLQAVDIRVFVSVFFITYPVVLACGVARIHFATTP